MSSSRREYISSLGEIKRSPISNPAHGLSKSIVSIYLYAIFPQCQKDFMIILLEEVSHIILLMKHGNYWRRVLKILMTEI
jgi:hypothetical protein